MYVTSRSTVLCYLVSICQAGDWLSDNEDKYYSITEINGVRQNCEMH